MENSIKRVTKRMKYEAVISLLEGNDPAIEFAVEDAIDFLKAELELVVKKNSTKSAKLTPTQEANKGYQQLILSYLYTQSEPKTCSEIKNAIPELSVFESQKVAALLRSLYLAEMVDKQTVKGKTRFSIRG